MGSRRGLSHWLPCQDTSGRGRFVSPWPDLQLPLSVGAEHTPKCLWSLYHLSGSCWNGLMSGCYIFTILSFVYNIGNTWASLRRKTWFVYTAASVHVSGGFTEVLPIPLVSKEVNIKPCTNFTHLKLYAKEITLGHWKVTSVFAWGVGAPNTLL